MTEHTLLSTNRSQPLLYLAWVPPEEQSDQVLHISWNTGGQRRKLLLLVAPALQSHCSIERVMLAKYLIGDGTHSPGICLAVVNHHTTAWNRSGHLWADTSRRWQ